MAKAVDLIDDHLRVADAIDLDFRACGRRRADCDASRANDPFPKILLQIHAAHVLDPDFNLPFVQPASVDDDSFVGHSIDSEMPFDIYTDKHEYTDYNRGEYNSKDDIKAEVHRVWMEREDRQLLDVGRWTFNVCSLLGQIPTTCR